MCPREKGGKKKPGGLKGVSLMKQIIKYFLFYLFDNYKVDYIVVKIKRKNKK